MPLISNDSLENFALFRCNSTSEYISSAYLCDDTIDCSKGEDEKNCDLYNEGIHFQCHDNEKLIPYQFVCNHIYDCKDKSDEINCRKNLYISI